MSDVNSISQTPFLTPLTTPAQIITPQQPTGRTEDHLTLSEALFKTNLESISHPILSSPSKKSLSMSAFFLIISSARLRFYQRLNSNEIKEQTFFADMKTNVISQSFDLLNKLNAHRQTILNAELVSEKETSQLKEMLNLIELRIQDQQMAIANINKGNAAEQKLAMEQLAAYQDFIQTITQLGAVSNADGTFILPVHLDKDAYHQAATIYAKKTESFNAYWNQRKEEINQYNALTQAYNSHSNQINQSLASLIDRYRLTDIMKENDIPSIYQPSADTRDISDRQDHPYPSQDIHSVPTIVYTAPPPNWVSLSASQVPSVSKIPYSAIGDQEFRVLKEAIHQAIYHLMVPSFSFSLLTSSFLNLTRIYHSLDKMSLEPLLNYKPLLNKIIPDALIKPSRLIKVGNGSGGIGALAMEILGLKNIHIENLLAKSLFNQAIQNLLIDIKEQERDEIANQLLVLTTSLLGIHALQSLPISLRAIANAPSPLPPNHPAYALLFSIACANGIQESIRADLTADVVKMFVNNLPQLAQLCVTHQATLITQLTPIINLTLLVVSTKLLLSHLSIPGLTSFLLPTFLPPDLVSQVLKQNTQEKQMQNTLHAKIEQAFIQQGYRPNESLFLAQIGTEFINQGLLLASSASIITAEAIEPSFLFHSIAAALVLSGYDVDCAKQIAKQAIQQTWREKSFHSFHQFNLELESKLRVLGVGKNASLIASYALLLPKKQPLAYQQPNSAISDSSYQNQLFALIDHNMRQLMAPQLGIELTSYITQNLNEILLGSLPHLQDNQDDSLPSLTHLIHDEVKLLLAQNNQTEALATVFKEFHQEKIESGKFLEELMEPIRLLAYVISIETQPSNYELLNRSYSIDIAV